MLVQNLQLANAALHAHAVMPFAYMPCNQRQSHLQIEAVASAM